jgi:hypothetical protein
MPKPARHAPASGSPARVKTAQPDRPRRWTGLLLALGGVLLVIAALFFALRQPQPPAATGSPAAGDGPRLSADKSQVDLGDQKLGNTVDVSFTLTNTGSAALKFSSAPYIEVKEGC